VVEVSSGECHCVAVDEEGGLWTWGSGSGGKLGHGDEQHRAEPTQVKFIGSPSVPRIRTALGGFDHTQAVSAAGVLYSWGSKYSIGIDAEDDVSVPMQNPTLRGVRVRQMTGSFENHCVALTEAGEVYTWGTGDYGQLGHGTREEKDVPTLVTTLLPPLTTEQALLLSDAARKLNELAPVLRNLRTEFAGPSFFGGLNGRNGLEASRRIVVGDLGRITNGFGAERLSSPVVEVAAGQHHTVARLADGRIFTWGQGEHGALGHGDTENQLVPKLIDMGALLPPRA
jgi:RCC1 and BTB domain-containing protein